MHKTLTAQVDADGVLSLTVRLGSADANKTVRVTVETVDETTTPARDQQAWLEFIECTAGSITDPTFQRHPQGTVEERDPLS